MNRSTNKFYSWSTIIIAVFSMHYTMAQTNRIDTLKNRFMQYRDQDFTEKVFVHIDRTAYLTGETMWFKIYYVNGSSNQPATISKVAYVEVLDTKSQRVLEGKIKLENGIGDGAFFIPATVTSGNYVVRAYTAWMKNKSPEYFFHQNITIINPFKKIEQTKTAITQKIDAQFFPEGGNLVTNVTSKVAYRVTDDKGVGLKFDGALVDSKNDTILRFKPDRFGIGTFELLPTTGAKYTAIIDTGDGKKLFPIPQALDEGFSLQVKTTDNSIETVIKSTVQNAASPVVYLFVHSNNEIIVAETKFLNNGTARFLIDKSRLAEGISHITLFDSELNPVCERLYYKKPESNLSVTARVENKEYGIRSKVKLKIEVQGSEGKESNLSVSIYRKDSLAMFSHENISSYLMLTSNLTGRIESPEVYLLEGTEEMFDNLMLTHGWRKFTWKNVLSSGLQKPAYLPELQGPILRAKLVDENANPAANVKTYLATPSKNIKLYGSFSDQNGKLHYVAPEVIGKQKMIFQTNFSRDSVYTFQIESPFIIASLNQVPSELAVNPGLKNTILSRSVALQVQDIFYQEAVRNPLNVDSTAFYGNADEVYFLDDYTRFPVMEEVMREYVKGVWVRRKSDGFYFKVLDNINKSVFNEDPLMLLDGVPLFDTDKIMAFDPKKIKKIEVMTRKFFLGRHSFAGIVSFSTYAGDLAGFELDKKSVILDYEGLQAQRIFYTPAYDTERQRSSRLPDQRTLLLWKPNLNTFEGNAEIDVYTSDIEGEYEINVQGTDGSGKAGNAYTTFKVFSFRDE